MFLSYFLFVFFFSSRRRHTRCALVTGVQTCALPIYTCVKEALFSPSREVILASKLRAASAATAAISACQGVGGSAEARTQIREIGRASCRERVCQYV